jgi:glucose-6-phosphate 1-dehydrogenase
MIQSHLLQLLTLVAMEPPAAMDAESLRDEKVKVLKSVRPIEPGAVHAQPSAPSTRPATSTGRACPATCEEARRAPDSVTETYAAMKLYIDNWRWRGVPFYLRTGKRMAEARSMVSICFKHPPLQFFRGTQVERMEFELADPRHPALRMLRMEITAKEPGLEMRTRQTSLDASLRRKARPATTPTRNCCWM